ncbi:MAG: hypothetical protein JRH20_09825 [Deltaproteobacteria bacterium]|nr:hypothetical protein [Deltaproteobacteria bacterium]
MFVTQRFIWGFIGAWALLLGAACSDEATPEPPQPKLYGVACVADDDCASSLCVDEFCSKRCSKLADCGPVTTFDPNTEEQKTHQFVCGLARETTVACYPKKVVDEDHATGYDCSVGGEMACGIGWKCLGVEGSTDRYCSPLCQSDKECLPSQRCANVTFTREGEPEMRCMERKFGHPCTIDDQCGEAADLCITDTNGNKYCSKDCEGAGTCPEFAECVDAGNGKNQCKHKSGFTYAEDGGLCDPCIVHYQTPQETVTEPGNCLEGGLCILLSPYTNETGCAAPCTGEACTAEDPDCGDDGMKYSCPARYACTIGEPHICVPVVEGPQGLEIGSCQVSR